MAETVIKCKNIGKKYKIGSKEKYLTLRDSLINAVKLPYRLIKVKKNILKKDEFWALKNISFEVKKGEIIGIIGKNGAGKSTMLKILSRITEPTEGNIVMKGRVASLLEVGTGFHSELTGRENIYLNGSILGMKKKEIDKKFNEIVKFSGVEKFLDTPVKRYSSGMYVRLAFAVAAHLEPDILIIDEVLAVGDVEFQKKCLGKMKEVAFSGRTVLFVSHNMAAVKELCPKCFLLKQGKIKMFGETKKIIDKYLNNDKSTTSLKQTQNRTGNGLIKFTGFYIIDESGSRINMNNIKSGINIILVFSYKCPRVDEVKNVDVGFSFHQIDTSVLSIFYSSYVGKLFNNIKKSGKIYCKLNKLPLAPGSYSIGLRMLANNIEADWPKDKIAFIKVESGNFYQSTYRINSQSHFLLKGNWFNK